MHSKTFLVSALVAFASVSLASEHEHEHENRGSHNDNFGDVPLLAQSTNDNVQGPLPVQKLLSFPAPAARQDTGSPFDDELEARSPHAPSAVTPQSEDDGAHQVDARALPGLSDLVHVPDYVKRAILDDPRAAELLAKELSGTNVPQWYAKLDEGATNYDATITPPPTMSIQAPEQEIVDYWISSISMYQSMISAQLDEMVLLASSESREASRLSDSASSLSTYATGITDSQLETSAFALSNQAVTMSSEAASIFSFAASASEAVFTSVDDEDEQSGASSTDMTLALGSSIVGAVVCLVFAIAL
ncbi:hypothetical protein A1O7_06043 [Cladophialophora yegresii CBS 114405]|uniref:Uncharacterized protein n=1 Tax=Cladophialophora yegresii CBS 114405 TaxID=1182544 RepID=W9W277_9EURO|nr:uncharacterized protein A1O7_06043 [Cladophialophora yegresii CBS 114405]EXJ58616.1 hypothetical protein A1O7_06043 [Cladophialophora yegresii CBS 114405]